MKKSHIFISFLPFLFVAHLLSAQYDPDFELRLNCGNSGATGQFAADQYFDGERQFTSSYVTLAEPFKSIRFTKTPTTGQHTMNYSIPVENGSYTVTLHFLEIYFGVSGNGGVGSRVFDVSLEGQLVENDLDILDRVGQNVVYSPQYTANVTDGQLTIFFSASAGDPIISAIEVEGINSSDTEPPSTVPFGSFQSGNITDTTVDLSWGAASDNVGVVGYRIYQGYPSFTDLVQTLGNVTSTQIANLTPSTGYQFAVAAFDAANLEGPKSGLGVVTLDSPANGTGGYWSKTSSTVYYNSGSVGIGTTTPGTYKLAVNGHIRAKEIVVEQANWPDYVFSDEHTLPSLEEVEKHIEENGHLINIPSAGEVHLNGIEVGEMNRLLLEKIEELTLYILAQDKMNKTLKTGLSELQNEVNLLKQKP